MSVPTSRVICLADHDEAGLLLTKEQARCIIEAERLHEYVWVEMDFSGVVEVGAEFLRELFPAGADTELKTWIVPRNYSREVEILIAGYFCHLQRLRDLQSQKAFDHTWLNAEASACTDSPNRSK